jgi:hypothetical protein
VEDLTLDGVGDVQGRLGVASSQMGDHVGEDPRAQWSSPI